MSFDLEKILASKRTLRRDLAARPIAEKLRMLDAVASRHHFLHIQFPMNPRYMPKADSSDRAHFGIPVIAKAKTTILRPQIINFVKSHPDECHPRLV